MTGSHVTRSHVTRSHVTRSHVIGSHVTGSHLTGSHMTGSHMTGSHMTGRYVLTFCVCWWPRSRELHIGDLDIIWLTFWWPRHHVTYILVTQTSGIQILFDAMTTYSMPGNSFLSQTRYSSFHCRNIQACVVSRCSFSFLKEKKDVTKSRVIATQKNLNGFKCFKINTTRRLTVKNGYPRRLIRVSRHKLRGLTLLTVAP